MVNNFKPNKSTFFVQSENEPLSQKEIKTLLINAIQSYKKHKITLNDMVKLAEIIEKNSQLFVSQQLRNMAAEIRSFSYISDVLDDMLNELIESEKNL